MKYNPYKIYWVASVVLFSMAFVVLWWCCDEWSWWLLYFLAINFVAGLMYLVDKVIAGKNKFIRVPEIILHTLALLGGSPIALISQKLFHHKVSKKSFVIIYWLIVLFQVGVLFWFFRKNYWDNNFSFLWIPIE